MPGTQHATRNKAIEACCQMNESVAANRLGFFRV